MGNCQRGSLCLYLHHGPPGCPVWAKTKFCSNPNCKNLHLKRQDTIPFCRLFAQGQCNRDNCSFLHVKKESGAICEYFVHQGYCRLGPECPKNHFFLCPIFFETQKCDNLQCRFPHQVVSTEYLITL